MVKIFRLRKSDEEIIRLIRNGDDKILTYLYEKNKTMILNYVSNNSGTAHDASEMLQEAIVIFWENVRRKNFTLSSKISTYLYGIVKNSWLKELARRAKLTDLQPLHSNPSDNPELSEAEEELTQLVKLCLNRLSDLCKKILTLYYYENKSMSEISQMTGLANENVVKSKKYQCKKDLEHLIRSFQKKSEGLNG